MNQLTYFLWKSAFAQHTIKVFKPYVQYSYSMFREKTHVSNSYTRAQRLSGQDGLKPLRCDDVVVGSVRHVGSEVSDTTSVAEAVVVVAVIVQLVGVQVDVRQLLIRARIFRCATKPTDSPL